MMPITLSANGINTPIKRQTATFKDPTFLWQESHMKDKDDKNILTGQKRLHDPNCKEKIAGLALSDTDMLPGIQTLHTDNSINSPKNRPLIQEVKIHIPIKKETDNCTVIIGDSNIS